MSKKMKFSPKKTKKNTIKKKAVKTSPQKKSSKNPKKSKSLKKAGFYRPVRNNAKSQYSKNCKGKV